MIKVTKDLTNIPISLIPAFPDLFPERVGRRVVPIPQQNTTTHSRRMEAINLGVYTDNENFNSRYKQDDIRAALQNVYKGKCAFCEQREEVSHIEHYRPKSKYYWLAYSWDNLLMACPSCNMNKGTHFDLDGSDVVFDNLEVNIRTINSSSVNYDASELPKMVNPEITEPLGQICFDKDGKIKSDNPRFKYTIEKCQIDRKSLNDSRRSLLDRFKEHIRAVFVDNKEVDKQLVAISTNVRNFIRDSKNDNEEFLAFRRYTVTEDWLNDIIKELN